jgi:predicted ATPase
MSPGCLEILATAANLFRGDFLTGFTLPDCPEFDEWQFFQAEGLRQQLAGVLERLVDDYSAKGEYQHAIPYARRRVGLDTLHEPAHRQLMQLYAWSGQQAAALRQYDECVRILDEELSASPSEETTTLYEAIKAKQAAPPLSEGVGSAQSLAIRERESTGMISSPSPQPRNLTSPHNLPAQTTAFIGRTTELAEVRELLSRPEVRLLTLTGPGGTGKTRLGLHAAAAALDEYADGIFLVTLAPISDPALVAMIIAETLGVRLTGDRPVVERLKEFLQDKVLLLVLDNFEHVLAAAPVISELLAASPRLKVLVTSRTLLRLSGEWDYPVPPLALPDPNNLPSLANLAEYEAVQLFDERARAVKSNFALTRDNAPAVAELCVKLDGLPLAIELAAARIRLLPPQKILTQLSSRLQFLKGGARDWPTRQQTLRDTIDWSYDLLDKEELILFRRLAIFAGGCTFEAAEAVGSPDDDVNVLNGLESLVDKNLLKQTEVTDEPRFEMLETIREYGLERLAQSGEAEALRQAHARYFMALAEEAEPHMFGPEQATWVKRLETEHDNLRAALAWTIDNAIEIGVRLAGVLGRFWFFR